MALEEWKLKLNSTNVEVEVEAELYKKMFTLKANKSCLKPVFLPYSVHDLF